MTDYFSAEYPAGNAAGGLSYVWDPMQDSATTLHILWDSNSLRSTALKDIDAYAAAFMEKYPRESFPQLAADGSNPDFRGWALESHQIAIDFAYGGGLEFIKDPDPTMDAECDCPLKLGHCLDHELGGERWLGNGIRTRTS